MHRPLNNPNEMTRIYFCGSIRGGRELADVYLRIITMLGEFGTVLTEHVGNSEEKVSEDEFLTDRQIHDRDIQWIRDADLVIAEVTVPSLGVGYEIGRAIEMKKPVLCLYRGSDNRKLSAMIAGSEGVEVWFYQEPAELHETLSGFMARHVPHRTS